MVSANMCTADHHCKEGIIDNNVLVYRFEYENQSATLEQII